MVSIEHKKISGMSIVGKPGISFGRKKSLSDYTPVDAINRTYAGNTIISFFRIDITFNVSGLTYCFYMWCIFDNPDPIFRLQLVSLRKS